MRIRISVSELQEQTSKVIRRVRQERAEYIVTYRGRPVAVILPLDVEQAEIKTAQADESAMPGNGDDYERLAEEIRRAWPPDLSTQDLMDATRRSPISNI